MSQRLTRIWLLPLLFFAGQAMALGLGEIRLSSALNEPLRAEIELLAATTEELNNLTVQLASSETFARYGLDRPLFLSKMQFDVFKTGTVNGNIIRVRSTSPITEPFVTFLVEAQWSRGRLLREYTILLDPPTFAPPPVAQTQEAITAPSRSTQSDAGRIERAATPPPSQTPQAEPQRRAPPPRQTTPPVAAAPQPQQPTQSAAPPTEQPEKMTPPPLDRRPYDASSGEDLRVARGDTLWRIASETRPDSRLTMNQTMMAIFEANPEAFAGNINLLSAGASLRIPSADDIYRISRGEALSEVQRQHDAWGGSATVSPPQNSLRLVPPDEDVVDLTDTDTSSSTGTGYSREIEIEDRIFELETQVPDQDSMLEIRDNELAQLRAELARLRGEELPVLDDDAALDDEALDDEVFDDEALDDEIVDDDIIDDAADDEIFVDDGTDAGDESTDDTTAADDADVTPPVATTRPKQPSLVDTILDKVLSLWGGIAALIILVLVILVWFARRAGGDDDDDDDDWKSLDSSMEVETLASTERLSALAREDDTAMVVVEQESKAAMAAEMAADKPDEAPAAVADPAAATGTNQTLEDTFSSETAINLDQSDPIAEADFHMAYGLHDQAADLINGALEVEPEREDLLAKLCEVYFVWGNRDAFIDSAQKMKAAVGEAPSAEWDKIVIMGQQIADDHELFSGKTAGAATKAVDLSFDGALDEPGVLDIDFASEPDDSASDIIDLGAEQDTVEGGTGIDFSLDDEDPSALLTQEMPAAESMDDVFGGDSEVAATAILDDADAVGAPESTVETPTLEQQFDSLDATGELAALSDNEATEVASLDDELPSADATAEIDLDDLGLDLDALAATGLAADVEDIEDDGGLFEDADATSETPALDLGDLDATGTNEALHVDDLDITGSRDQLEPADVDEATGTNDALDLENALAATSETEVSAADATGRNETMADPFADSGDSEAADVGVDTSLLDATGQTQILTEDMAVETQNDLDSSLSDADKTMLAPGISDDDIIDSLADDAETLLAPLDDDDDVDGDFEFAKTEALPKDVFTGTSMDETGELPSLAGGTDVDLDLDDLTAALKVSEVGDTVNQPRDDATVEQPRLRPSAEVDLDVGMFADEGDSDPTQALSPEEVSGDLHDARTMTEVGTKLDLARAYVDMGDPGGARSILEEVLDEGDDSQRQQAQQLLDSLPS